MRERTPRAFVPPALPGTPPCRCSSCLRYAASTLRRRRARRGRRYTSRVGLAAPAPDHALVDSRRSLVAAAASPLFCCCWCFRRQADDHAGSASRWPSCLPVPPHLLPSAQVPAHGPPLLRAHGRRPSAVAVLGLGLLAMGEELGGQMSHRALEHLLQYGEPAVRQVMPAPLGSPDRAQP